MNGDIRRNIEQFILGALIYKNDNFDLIRNIIERDDFLSEIHKEIYRVIEQRLSSGNAVDFITLVHFAAQKDIDIKYIEDINNAGKSCSNVVEYANVLKEMSLNSQLIQISQSIDQQHKDGKSLSDRIRWVEDAVTKLNYMRLKDDYVQFKDAALSTIDTLYDNLDKKTNYAQTGFEQLDAVVQGFRPGELICIAGRPAVGKTTFALQLILNVIKVMSYMKILFVSLEMSANELCLKILSNISGVPLSAFSTGRISTNTLHECVNLVHNTVIPLIIYDSCHLTIGGLRSMISKAVRCDDIKIVVLDYLQLIESKNRETREQEISEISRSLKLLAKEFAVSIIATCQLSREVEKQGRKPRLSDMRGSGAIEQDADKVMILHVDSESKTPNSNDFSPPNTLELIVAKNRNGPTGSVKFLFNKELNRFSEMI